jgi:hypothetical protein
LVKAAALDVDALADDVVGRMLDFFQIEDLYEPPSAIRTLVDDMETAAEMRRYMDARNLTKVCACCSCRCEAGYEDDEENDEEEGQPEFTTSMAVSEIPNVHLLRVDVESTAEFPRDCLTRIGSYCLQPDGIVHSECDDEDDPVVNVCQDCYGTLLLGRVPLGSLVRVDTGALPPDLKPLSLVEEQLLGLGRSTRKLWVMRPRGYDSDMQQWCFRGHVIAFPNVSAKDVSNCFPMAFSDIPKSMQVP